MRVEPWLMVSDISMHKQIARLWSSGPLHHGAAIGVLIAGLLLTGFVFLARQKADLNKVIAWANEEAQGHERTLRQGTRSYIDLNRTVAAFFAASDQVSSGEFDTYIKRLEALETHPALSAIGYVARVPREGVAGFEATIRKTRPGFEVRGVDDREADRYPLLYSFPENEWSRRWLGLDFADVSERRETMDKAVALGRSMATGKHAEPADALGRALVLVFTPVYDPSAPVNTLAQRRAALKGFVFSSFLADEMIEKVMGQRFKDVFDLEIYDSQAGTDNIVYDGDKNPHALTRNEAFVTFHQSSIDFAGRRWQLYFFPKASFFERHAAASDYLVLVAGLLASLTLAYASGIWLHRRRHKRALIERGRRFESLFENHPFAVYYVDAERRFVNLNAKALDEFQASREELVGAPVEQFIVPENRAMARERWEEVLAGNAVTYDNVVVGKQGRRSDVNLVLIPISIDGKVGSALGIAQNITERKELEHRLREMALHDGLTGLPNRSHFYEQLERAIQRSKRRGSLLSLMYFDIDRFKQINDGHGHDVGDQVIALFAQRVRKTIRESDVVARLGGDEFSLIVEDLPSPQAVEVVAAKLIQAMQPAFEVGPLTLEVSTSIGIAFHAEGMGADALVRAADQTMYKAKQAGRSRFHVAAGA